MVEAVIFDYARTLYDPDTKTFYPEVPEILDGLNKKHIKLALVARDSDKIKRLAQLQAFGIDHYFLLIHFVSAEESKEFSSILQQLEVTAERCLVIGDRINSEIIAGNKIGARTIWIKQGKFKDELPTTEEEKPTYQVNSLKELIPLLEQII